MINKTTSAWDTNPFIKAPTACINSLLCSVIEGFKYKEKKWSRIDTLFRSFLC